MKRILILAVALLLYHTTPAQKVKELKGVTVTGKKPLIEQKADRVIVNLEAMIIGAGGSIMDALSRTPGVIVDMNDDIKLYGKSGILVLIDDRPTHMSSKDLALYLRSLPADMLDKIELITNPPARYDAAGGAIINLVLKKSKTRGFNGNVSAGYSQGAYGRGNSALNLNYRTRKYNLFGNMSYSTNKGYAENKTDRKFFSSDATLLSTVSLINRNKDLTTAWNARLGVDYFLSSKTTLGILLNGNTRPKSELLTYTSDHYNGFAKPDSTAAGYTSGTSTWKNASLNLNLQHKFSPNKILTADMDYVSYRSISDQYMPDFVYWPDGSLKSNRERIYQQPVGFSIYSGKVDQTLPFPGRIAFSTGMKASFVQMDNEADWFDKNGNTITPDYTRTNYFRYTENVNSAYISLKREWNRLSLQSGLRLENVRLKGDQQGNALIRDSAFTRTYTNLFPSIHLMWKLDSSGHHVMTLAFSQRIRRPNYQQLNPFLLYRDKYSYTAGNPDLLPGYIYSFDFRYNFRHFLGVSLGYMRDKNPILSATEAVGDIFISRPRNFGISETLGIVTNLYLNPYKWWVINGTVLMLFMHNTGDVNPNRHTNIHEVEMSNQFTLGNGWNAELNGFFPGRQSWGQAQGSSLYDISAGLQKSVLGKKGRIRLEMNDIFNTRNSSIRTIGIQQVTAMTWRKGDTQRIGVSFSYRFGREANSRKRNHDQGGAADEQGRVN